MTAHPDHPTATSPHLELVLRAPGAGPVTDRTHLPTDDDGEMDAYRAAYLARFPSANGCPRYCSTCPFRDPDDSAARQIFWHEHQADQIDADRIRLDACAGASGGGVVSVPVERCRMVISGEPAVADIQKRLDSLAWYHTVDVVPGATTKGWFDLRHALGLMPFPDVRGKRCLDVGTWDGFYAYEMERRGAAAVVAIDVPDLADVDYPPEIRAREDFDPSSSDTQPRPAGFRLLHEILDSKVEWRAGNIYDLDPEELGTFDVVIVGSLLVHLRDPVRALDAVRQVTRGVLLSADYLHPPVNLLARRGRPLFELRGEGSDFQWWLASDAGLRQLLRVGGFEIDEASPYFLLRPGPAGAPGASFQGVRGQVKRLANRIVTGDATAGGHLHRAYLAHPRY